MAAGSSLSRLPLGLRSWIVVAAIAISLTASMSGGARMYETSLGTRGALTEAALPTGRAETAVGTVSTGYLPVSAAYDDATAEVFVENEGSDNVSVISTQTQNVVASIPLAAVEGYPMTPSAVTMVWNPGNGDLYLTDGLSANVTVISGTSDKVVASIPVGGAPDGLALSSNYAQLFVSNAGSGYVGIIDTLSNNLSATVPTSSWTSAVAFDSSTNDAYAMSNFSTSVIDSAGQIVSSLQVTGVLGARIAFDSATNELLVMDGISALEAVDASSGNVTARAALCEFPEGLTISPNGSLAYVVCPSPAGYAASYSSVEVIAVANMTIEQSLAAGPSSGYSAVAISPSGDTVYVANSGSGSVTYYTPSNSSSTVVQFTSAGLPGGVGWGVAMTGWTWLDSEGTTLTFTLADNSSSYLIRSASSRWSPNASSGQFLTTQSEVSISVGFSAELFAVTFQENGASSGGWSVDFAGTSQVSFFDLALTFYEFNGTYSYVVSGPPGLAATPTNGFLNVSGAPLSVVVSFTPVGSTSSPTSSAFLPWLALGLAVIVAVVLIFVMLTRRRRRVTQVPSSPYGRI